MVIISVKNGVKRREIPIKLLKYFLGKNKEPSGFRLFFLGKEDLDVEIVEVNKIDFDDLERQLQNGKSVFVTTLPEMN